jgi:head-tail adaptor
MRFRDGARLYRIGAVSEADATGRYLVCFASEETGA